MIYKKVSKFIYILAVLIIYSFSSNIAYSVTTNPNTGVKYSSSSDLYDDIVKSILFIETNDSQGTGVILKDDGTFVTCFHVIANADFINTKLNDGSEYSVNGFKYLNPLTDVAILTLDTNKKFIPIRIDQSQSLKIGEKIYTISNPQGYNFSFSDGILSQFDKNHIQFTAPISPGSSGGALINKNGNLIGIITSMVEDAQSINFALPNNYFVPYINTKSIINVEKLSWIDFVSKKLDLDEFSLISDYFINNNKIIIWYKYFRDILFSSKEELPIEIYPILGFISFSNLYWEDAIEWYKLSYYNNYNKEICVLALSILYAVFEGSNGKNCDFWMKKIFDFYPVTSEWLIKVFEKSGQCRKETNNDEYCNLELGLELTKYIYENTGFDWK